MSLFLKLAVVYIQFCSSIAGPEEGHTNWSGQEVSVVKDNAPLIDVIKSCMSYSLLFILYKQLWFLCKIKYMSYFQFVKYMLYHIVLILSNLYNNELVSY